MRTGPVLDQEFYYQKCASNQYVQSKKKIRPKSSGSADIHNHFNGRSSTLSLRNA